MRVFVRRAILDFCRRFPDAEQSMLAWYAETKRNKWRSPQEIKSLYPSASFLRDNRVVFNIKGNKYRLVVRVNYERNWVFIRFAGTHAEYDRIDAVKI